jgi:hypothetical protein
MQYKVVFPLVILALLGLFFLGDGITGLVVSQNCCYPPNCPVEKLCLDARIAPMYSNVYLQGVYIGGILLLLAILGYTIIRKK